jgi:hypothetical protein
MLAWQMIRTDTDAACVILGIADEVADITVLCSLPSSTGLPIDDTGTSSQGGPTDQSFGAHCSRQL